MAKGTKELKARITGVQNIQKITSAMEMVATQKLKRLQGRAESARPYAEKIQEMVARLAKSVQRPDLSPLLQSRKIECVQHLVISADKGLCGGYNTNTVRMVQAVLADAEEGVEQRVQVLGSKGARLLAAKGLPVDGVYEDVVEKIDFIRVRNLTRELVTQYLNGEIDQLNVVYTAFLSAGRQRAATVSLLPIDPESLAKSAIEEGGKSDEGVEFIVEPDQETLLKNLLPKFLEVKVYSAILESLASEFTARRNAMKQATDSADDMIHSLKREYNRARQESITNELLEVISGAEALK